MNKAPVSANASSSEEDVRTGLDKATLKRAFKDNLFYLTGARPINYTQMTTSKQGHIGGPPGDGMLYQYLSILTNTCPGGMVP